MIKGIYTAAAGMLATSVGTDTLANNLANVNTIGFKSSNLQYQSFPAMLLSRMGGEGQVPIGSVMTGSKVYGTVIDFKEGALKETGNAFDLAMRGSGFFTVKTPDGQVGYTRAGNFTVNEQGYLITPNGDFVQGDKGNIQLSLEAGPFKINEKGHVLGKNGLVENLKIAHFADNSSLVPVGNSIFQATAASQQLDPIRGDKLPSFKVEQGYLEESNVNPIAELVNNIQGMRLYEALQKNIHLHSETLQKAVNEVGRNK